MALTQDKYERRLEHLIGKAEHHFKRVSKLPSQDSISFILGTTTGIIYALKVDLLQSRAELKGLEVRYPK